MKTLRFETCQNIEEHFQNLWALMLPYCKELDQNAGRKTPESTLERFARSVLQMAQEKDRFLEFCYDGDDLIGFFYGKIDRDGQKGNIRPGWGYVMEFYVTPEHRRQGFGTAMYQRLAGLFAEKGVKRLWLTADPVTGVPFWESMGFQKSGEKSSENHLDILEKL